MNNMDVAVNFGAGFVFLVLALLGYTVRNVSPRATALGIAAGLCWILSAGLREWGITVVAAIFFALWVRAVIPETLRR